MADPRAPTPARPPSPPTAAPTFTAHDGPSSSSSSSAPTGAAAGEIESTGAQGSDERAVFFFDIDNCLYPKSLKIINLMSDLIDAYFAEHLRLPASEAAALHTSYYKTYGLAIEGLVQHHGVSPLHYNARVDDALPLESLLSPSPALAALLAALDRARVRPWLLTNAHATHARRVVGLLGVADAFEGLTYCDYGAWPLVCKPARAMYVKAMREAGVLAPRRGRAAGDEGGEEEEEEEDGVSDAELRAAGRRCFFVDDSWANVRAAEELAGWTGVHLVEEGEAEPAGGKAGRFQVRELTELRGCFPEFFGGGGEGDEKGDG